MIVYLAKPRYLIKPIRMNKRIWWVAGFKINKQNSPSHNNNNRPLEWKVGKIRIVEKNIKILMNKFKRKAWNTEKIKMSYWRA